MTSVVTSGIVPTYAPFGLPLNGVLVDDNGLRTLTNLFTF